MNKILIVEDETDIRENIEDILTCADYNVLSAKNGKEALDILDSITPDVIISDIRMPELTGFELLKEISENNHYGQIPFLLLTALSNREDIRYGMDLGADDYILKPFTPEELLNSVNRRITKAEKNKKQLERLKSNIIKYIPHELRTPLTPILGYSRMLLEDIKSFTEQEIIEMILTIKKSGLRLSKRIENFIMLSELFSTENNTYNTEGNKYLRYNITTNEILKFLQDDEELNGRKKDLIVNIEPSTIIILDFHFKFIIRELIENASKFSNIGSKIRVEGRKNNNYYEIAVTDSGIGMTKNEIRNITAFEQHKREKLQQIGNGLGLVIVKFLLQSIDGIFSISSEKGKFTKVIISIPFAL